MKLPEGSGTPAADIRGAVAEATLACRGVTTFSAELAVSGSIGGNGLRGRMLIGVAAPASARIEAVAPFGQPVFILVARGAEATLLLPREDRVVERARPDAVLEAVTGVPIDAAELRTVLTGCPAAPDIEGGRSLGEGWRVVNDGPREVYLRRASRSGPWQVAATVHNGSTASAAAWRAEYRELQNGLPRAIHLVASDSRRFDLRLTLSQVEINATLGADVFHVDVPRSARPMTLEELRDARPGLRKD